MDLKAAYEELREELDCAYRRVMSSGSYILGEECDAFEREFAEYCGTKYCIGVSNGLDALELALRAIGIGSGDEVLVPSHTYIATWLAVSATGAVPVPVEPQRETYNLDPSGIDAVVTRRSRAIIAVHLYGQPADMDGILAAAERYGLAVLEDAAQAQGARHRGRRTGSLGHAAAFSFYPVKNLGAFGDAGAVTTNDEATARRLRLLRNYGASAKYHHEIRGFNRRLDEFQAAMLRVKLRHLDDWNERRGRLAKRYLSLLDGSSEVVLPHVPEWAEPVWHQFVVCHPERDALRERLARAGIPTLVHYPIPPHESNAYADERERLGNFPIARELAKSVLSLPIGPHVNLDCASRVASVVERSVHEAAVPPA